MPTPSPRWRVATELGRTPKKTPKGSLKKAWGTISNVHPFSVQHVSFAIPPCLRLSCLIWVCENGAPGVLINHQFPYCSHHFPIIARFLYGRNTSCSITYEVLLQTGNGVVCYVWPSNEKEHRKVLDGHCKMFRHNKLCSSHRQTIGVHEIHWDSLGDSAEALVAGWIAP